MLSRHTDNICALLGEWFKVGDVSLPVPSTLWSVQDIYTNVCQISVQDHPVHAGIDSSTWTMGENHWTISLSITSHPLHREDVKPTTTLDILSFLAETAHYNTDN